MWSRYRPMSSEYRFEVSLQLRPAKPEPRESDRLVRLVVNTLRVFRRCLPNSVELRRTRETETLLRS